MSTELFDRFKSALLSVSQAKENFRLGSEVGHHVYYVPFEHENVNARLVLVGITPGPTQMTLAWRTARDELRRGAETPSVLARVKQVAAFDGMRGRINSMLDHFEIPRHLGLGAAADLWGKNFQYFQPMSLIRNATFKGDDYFNGPFDSVLNNPLLRSQFESTFVAPLSRVSKDAVFVAMGPVVMSGLQWCLDREVIQKQQVLGYFPHASPSSGSQFDYFMKQKSLADLKPKDPVRHRAKALDAAYQEIASKVAARFGTKK